MEHRCQHCNAYYWVEEATSKKQYTNCCSNGSIKFSYLQPPNPLMQELFSGSTPRAKLFQSNIRKFNTCLAFASTLFKAREFSTGRGPPIVTIEGNIQHKIGSLFNDPNKVAAFMQCYFFDRSDQTTNADPRTRGNPYFRLQPHEVSLFL